MTKKAESRLYQRLKAKTEDKVFWTRLESWALPGVPDLHGVCDGVPFFVELKVDDRKKLGPLKLSPHQVGWQVNYDRHGGRVWNLVFHPLSSKLYLFGVNPDHRYPILELGRPYDWDRLVEEFIGLG